MWFLSYIVWDVNPVLIKVGPLAIRWYGIFFALGFLAGLLVLHWIYQTEKKPETSLDALLVYVMAGAVIGARLGHCLFYQPEYFLKHPLEILEVWQGGLASHGGVLGILVALYFYTRRRPEEPYFWLLDRVAVVSALAGCFIRIGNLFNSEILGTPASVPWAFVFRRVDAVPRHPVQIYEALSYALIFVFLMLVYRSMRERTPRRLLFGLFLFSVFSARFFLEFIKQRQADYEQNFSISVGQWLSIPFVLVGVLFVIQAWRSRYTQPSIRPPR